MNYPPFAKFLDQETKQYKALLLCGKDVEELLLYVHIAFTLNKIVFEDGRVRIKRYLCPHMRTGKDTWFILIMYVAELKKDVSFRYIVSFKGAKVSQIGSIGDGDIKRVLLDSIKENWKIEIKK